MAEEKSRNKLLWLVAIGFFMQTLDATIINTALPVMANSLGESPLRMQSVVIAYSLTMAMFIPASGWIADRFGTRNVFFGAILLFSLGSQCCASSNTLGQLVASRVLQGMGGAMLLPVGRLAVLRAFPREEFLRAMSFVTIPGLIGPLIGPALGGWLVEFFSWHWIFLINIPVGIIGCLATFFYMPDSRGEASRFDLFGYVLLSFSMVALSFSLESVSERGFFSAVVLALLISGITSLGLYWRHAGRRLDPLFSRKIFKVNTFRLGLCGNLFSRIGSGGMPFMIPLLLQVGLGYTPAKAGMMMVPTAIAGIFSKGVGTSIIQRLGYRKVLIGNTILVGLTIGSFALLSSDQPLWLRIVQLAIFGAANSLQFTAMNSVTLKDLGGHDVSSGNSLLSMVQMLAMSFGVAIAGAILGVLAKVFGDSTPLQSQAIFHGTFICMGLLTAFSAWIFWLMPSEKGRGDASLGEDQAAALSAASEDF